MSDAERKRMARRERILKRTADRMKYVSGEIPSLKDEPENPKETDQSSEIKPPIEENTSTFKRIDPRLRRRQAAERKQARGQDQDDDVATTGELPAAATGSADINTKSSSTNTSTTAAISKHAKYFKFQRIQFLCTNLLLVAIGVAIAIYSDNSHLFEELGMDMNDPKYRPYFDLLSQGISQEAVKQQMIREGLDVSKLFSTRTPERGQFYDNSWIYFFMNPFDCAGKHMASAQEHPPLILCVMAVYFITSIAFWLMRKQAGISDLDHTIKPKTPFSGIAGIAFNAVMSSKALGHFPMVVMRLMGFMEDMSVLLFSICIATLVLTCMANTT